MDAVGQSGGIWLLWRSAIGNVTVVNSTDQFIHVMIDNTLETWHLIVVYAAPNQALQAKMGWRLLHDKESLWAKVLRSKYKVGSIRDPSWLKSKGTWSSTWRSVNTNLRDVVLPGIKWVVGNGRDIKFWTDKWLLNMPIGDITSARLPAELSNASIRDLWKAESGWDWQHITPYVSDYTRLQLSSMVVDTITGVVDRISWGESSNGQFSVKSAYYFLTQVYTARQRMAGFFDRIWKVVAPKRVCTFLWLTGNQVIMTNKERNRRHLCASSLAKSARWEKKQSFTYFETARPCPEYGTGFFQGVYNSLSFGCPY